MARYALVRRVLIASPGDTEDLVRTAYEAIHTWNDARYLPQEMLEPVHWKTSVHLAFNAAGPQGEIDAQLVNTTDILVGIFRDRLGTPTAHAESGTVDEIKQHVESGRPAMVYFSNEPLDRNHSTQKLAKLKEFKSWCQRHGVVGNFADVSSFAKQLSHHLTLLVTRYPVSITARIREAGNESPGQLAAIMLRERHEFEFTELGLKNDGPELHCVTFRPGVTSLSNPFAWWVTFKDFHVRDIAMLKKREILNHMDHFRDSFKFYLRVRNDKATIRKYRNLLVNGNVVVTGLGDADPNDDTSWRVWFLHPEGFIHPYLARSYLANHSLVDLSGI